LLSQAFLPETQESKSFETSQYLSGLPSDTYPLKRRFQTMLKRLVGNKGDCHLLLAAAMFLQANS
jgi:hypothetical protein